MSFSPPRKWIAGAALVVALVGLCDAVYLTIHHYTAEPVPCSLTGGCEMVLTSVWATIGDIPLAAFGAAAYVVAAILALLSLRGAKWTWVLFGLQTAAMAAFSGWLIYIQAERIHAFCQFCLLSAATSFTLFLIFLLSLVLKPTADRGRIDI